LIDQRSELITEPSAVAPDAKLNSEYSVNPSNYRHPNSSLASGATALGSVNDLGKHPSRDRYEEEVFKEFFREALESGGAFVVIDRKTQKIIGSSRYFGFEPTKREIEIGWTFLARSHWGGKYNGELKRLMLDHAFRFVESVVFLIGPTNVRSQKAVEKIGGVLIERREKTNPDGTTVERVVYQIKKPTNTAST
jgi:RimJ/RimL family protein N-acetyltransferase